MKLFSNNLLKISLVSSLAAITITTIAVAQSNPTTNTKTSSISYTASGKTDLRTAKMFKQLMQNNPNLQLNAQISHSNKREMNNGGISVEVNYTFKGKTDIKTARKLISLFKNSKHIEVVVNYNPKALQVTQNKHFNNTVNYQPINPPPVGYMPFYYYNQHGYQQIYVQKVAQPTIWYKLPSNPSQEMPQPPYNMDYTLL